MYSVKGKTSLSWQRQRICIVLSNTTNATRQHWDLDHLHALVQPCTNGQMLVFVGAEFIKCMQALNTTASNFLLFWYLSKVDGLYSVCRSCAGAVTVQDCFRKPKIVQIQSKQTASHPSKFTRRAGFCKQFSQLKLPQDTTCSPATDILLSLLLSTASPPAAEGNKKPVPTSL